MKPISCFTILLSALAGWLALSPTSRAGDGVQTPDTNGSGHEKVLSAGGTWRVGGDLFTKVVRRGDRWVSGSCQVDAPLPDGYPAPTPPGALELKRYPEVRRAWVSGTSHPDLGQTMGFWPLFQHIQKRKIAMTAPVEVDYEGLTSGSKAARWTMAFLYRQRNQGDKGQAGRVQVTDAPAVTVLSIGVQGPYSLSRTRAQLRTLEAWLARRPDWKAAGEPRALFYNGPYRRSSDKWSEVQIPVQRVKPPRAGSEQHDLRESL